MNAPSFGYFSDEALNGSEYAAAVSAVSDFEHATGRLLTTTHRRMIATLEWLRSQSEKPRTVWIHDDGKCGDTVRELLADYMLWIDGMINQPTEERHRVSRTLIMARGLKASQPVCSRAPRGHFIPATIRRPLSVYGQRWLNALVLDADRCPDSVYGNRYREMRRAVVTATPECGMVIVHGNARRWSTEFSAEFKLWAAADNPITVVAANPVNERRAGWNRQRPRKPHPEEAALIKKVEEARERLGLVNVPKAYRTPDERLLIRHYRACVAEAEEKLGKWRTTFLPVILERTERRRVLEIIYELSAHIPRKRPGDEELSIEAGEKVERTLRRRKLSLPSPSSSMAASA